MSNTLKRRSILPAWWWITLTGLPVLSLLSFIPEVHELIFVDITRPSGNGHFPINILGEIVRIATFILLLLPLFIKSIHLNIPARIGLIAYIVGVALARLLWYIIIFDPERKFIEIEYIANICISFSNLFSWLLFVWSICAHWTLKVVLTAKLLFAYLILFFGFTLLVGLFDCDYEEASVIRDLILRINEFMAFAATLLIVLIAQPKQPVPATDEPTQIE